MNIYKYEDMKGGWFIGDFYPSAYKTTSCEVCLKYHKKDEVWERHIHEHLTEINLIINGKMIIQGTKLRENDIFVLNRGEIADPVFITDCVLVVVKIPGVKGDKKLC